MSRVGQLLIGHGEVCAGDDDVGAADVFVQRALVSERNAGGGNGVPESRRRIDHGARLLIGDRGLSGP